MKSLFLAPALRHRGKPHRNNSLPSQRVPCAPWCLGFLRCAMCKLRGFWMWKDDKGLDWKIARLELSKYCQRKWTSDSDWGHLLRQFLHQLCKKLVSDSGVSKNTFRQTLDLKTRNNISCIYKSCSIITQNIPKRLRLIKHSSAWHVCHKVSDPHCLT